MAKKKDTELAVDELAAIGADMRKASEVAARFAACGERLAEARRGAAPERVEAVEAREAAAAVDELGQLVEGARQRTLRFAARCERLAAAGRVAAVDEARFQASLASLRVAAKIFNALWGSAASGRRLAAIEARAGEADRLATIEALAEFIGELCRGKE